MNKIKALVTALVVASSSTAMASPTTFSASVRGSFTVGSSWSTPAPQSKRAIIVRDHRTSRTRYVPPAPVRPARQLAQWHYEGDRYQVDRYEPAQPAYDYSGFQWKDLGTRSAIAPDYVQVPSSIQAKALRVEATEGNPRLANIEIRYYGGVWHTIDASQMTFTRGGVVLPIDTSGTLVHQIVFNPAAGSTGAVRATVAY